MTSEPHTALTSLTCGYKESFPSPILTRSDVVAGGRGEVLTAGLRMAQLAQAVTTAAVKYHFGQNGTDIVHSDSGEDAGVTDS